MLHVAKGRISQSGLYPWVTLVNGFNFQTVQEELERLSIPNVAGTKVVADFSNYYYPFLVRLDEIMSYDGNRNVYRHGL